MLCVCTLIHVHISWERRRDPQGRIYYVDHNTRTTTWQKPTTENVRNFQQWQRQEATNLEQRSQQHQQRFLLGGAAGGNGSASGTQPAPRDPSDDGLGALPDGWGEQSCHIHVHMHVHVYMYMYMYMDSAYDMHIARQMSIHNYSIKF